MTTVSIIKPLEGLRYVQIKATDGHRILVPINEERWKGVQHSEAIARRMLEEQGHA